uniref:Uncharacterized protein n=1 Tax=Heterorhabditis bacteriophora TaxID=37862 RepID=A0A1I7WXU8_HETBA
MVCSIAEKISKMFFANFLLILLST